MERNLMVIMKIIRRGKMCSTRKDYLDSLPYLIKKVANGNVPLLNDMYEKVANGNVSLLNGMGMVFK